LADGPHQAAAPTAPNAASDIGPSHLDPAVREATPDLALELCAIAVGVDDDKSLITHCGDTDQSGVLDAPPAGGEKFCRRDFVEVMNVHADMVPG
jgi:hypothetical protein